MSKATPWWGKFQLAEEQMICWLMGERKVIIQRHPTEWNTWNIESEHENGDPLVQTDCVNAGELDDKSMVRHLQKATQPEISVQPALADRSVVVRPNTPLQILGGETALIYVSTPLWFKAQIPTNTAFILDVPFWRPSDSWFGPSSIEGELCYAKYTDARFKLESLERRPHRAITSIRIHNKPKDILLIERLNVPVPLLNLYGDADNTLWTNAINVTRNEDDSAVELHLENKAPQNISEPTFVASSRVKSERHNLIRTIGSLFK